MGHKADSTHRGVLGLKFSTILLIGGENVGDVWVNLMVNLIGLAWNARADRHDMKRTQSRNAKKYDAGLSKGFPRVPDSWFHMKIRGSISPSTWLAYLNGRPVRWTFLKLQRSNRGLESQKMLGYNTGNFQMQSYMFIFIETVDSLWFSVVSSRRSCIVYAITQA